MTIPTNVRSLEERFHSKYCINVETGCWEWLAYKNHGTGYGRIQSAKPFRALSAHRVSYELHIGKIPAGLTIDHLCRNRACVNPQHLEAVTHLINMERGTVAARTSCNNGHPFTDSNTSSHHGYRRCKECHRLERRLKYVAR